MTVLPARRFVDEIACSPAGLKRSQRRSKKRIGLWLGERGVDFVRYEGMEQDDLGVWRAPSRALIAWFRDPDGNTLSLAQF
jgi:hypothetical protein